MTVLSFGQSFTRRALLLGALGASLFAGPQVSAIAMEGDGAPPTQAYVDVPMPEGIHVEATELEGPVFADAQGHTLYTWPQKKLRNGYSGEPKGQIACYGEVLKTTAGLMSPYPSGVILPDLKTRPACTDLWKPVLAPEGAQEVGKWTILTGEDGRKQWAYDEQAVYTSALDSQPGDTIGGSHVRSGGEGGAVREPVGPPARVPPAFEVRVTRLGLLLTTDKKRSVYAHDGETAEKLACDSACTRVWEPVLAPEVARSQGEWSVVDRATGVRQWAFRGEPLYTYALDESTDSLGGSDEPGWHNVYTQMAPEPPASFTRQDSIAGEVLADADGMTIYIYNCSDDSQDQLSCEHPSDTQVYRLAMCGAGDPQVCQDHWRYVVAEDGAKSTSRAWSIVEIDPGTGHFAKPGQEGALRVWAYRDRPVYTYYLDKKPGDVRGDGTGEWRGGRNGLKAFWLRGALLRG